MKLLHFSIIFYILILENIKTLQCFNLFPIINNEYNYKISGSVSVGGQAPKEVDTPTPDPSSWQINGNVLIQRIDDETLLIKLLIKSLQLNNKIHTIYNNPINEFNQLSETFKVIIIDDLIKHILLNDNEPIWSANIKRAVAALLQVQGDKTGAFVANEAGINGVCNTEYYITNKTDYLSVRKTPELDTCSPHRGGIHLMRSNVPTNLCNTESQRNVVVGNEVVYELKPHETFGYNLHRAQANGLVMVHTFESTGEAQYVTSEMQIIFVEEIKVLEKLNMTINGQQSPSTLEFVEPIQDQTGGRFPIPTERIVERARSLLNSVADNLENPQLRFDEPYDDTISEIIRAMGMMNLESLQKLYKEIDIGTSYRQETARNIFLEILPRIGNKYAILLIRDLVINRHVKPTTAVQLLIAMPFYIAESNQKLVKDCESLLTLGPDRPDVRHAAVLSYSILIHQTFVSRQMSKDLFERYVKRYFDMFLESYDYEQQLLYLQALGNLQLGNVIDYLDPIIKENDPLKTDIRSVAIWVTMNLVHTRPQKSFELYWPIFENRMNPLELRVAAFIMLLISNPTPTRLISIHRIIQNETSLHMINFYRTTVLSLSTTTYPCYQYLRRLLPYMLRHLPKAPSDRYWVTGTYMLDYKDTKYGLGAMLQSMLIGDENNDLPSVIYFKFDTEALGKYTGQYAVYIKVRGLSDSILQRLTKLNSEHLKLNDLNMILNSMKIKKINNTPLHLELLLKIDGKTVLSYFLNQKTFHNLTDGDLINRINLILRADSHINMQTVRWPFMTRYSVPTIFGTTSGINIQSTLLISLRGNITQQITIDKITRNNQIDVRYKSYVECKSYSYNPILNLEHTIHREQGLLIYIPINNEVILSIPNKLLMFSFFRPENLTSGLSLRSRSLTTTDEYLTENSLYKTRNLPQPSGNLFELLNHEFKDFGVEVKATINDEDLFNHIDLMLNSNVLENFKLPVQNDFYGYLLEFASLLQLNTIHIGNNKDFTFLVTNPKSSKVEGKLTTDLLDLTSASAKLNDGNNKEIVIEKIDLQFIHKLDGDDNELNVRHRWDITIRLSEFLNDTKTKIIMVMKRKSKNKQWKLCLDGTYEPLVFMQNSHVIQGAIVFGADATAKGCPKNRSRIEIYATAGISDNAIYEYNNNVLSYHQTYPKELLKFNPPPIQKYCKKNLFTEFTTITDYKADIKFSNMPEWFKSGAHRLDHLISAISPKKVDKLNLQTRINATIIVPAYELFMNVELNGHKFKIANILSLMDQTIDAKYNTFKETKIKYGLLRECTVIGETIYTFNDLIINNINDKINNDTKNNCSILLAADCSDIPKFAIFLDYNKDNNNNEIYFNIKIYTGGNYITFKKINIDSNNTNIIVGINNEQTFNLRDYSIQYPALEKFYDFKAYVNKEEILIIENRLVNTEIQYDMNKLLTFHIPIIYKDKVCGLCNMPSKPIDNNLYCFP